MMMKHRSLCSALVKTLMLPAFMFAGHAALAVGGKFTPPEGETLLIIGQDIDSIDTYNRDLGITPGGVTGYTGINDLAGFTSVGDWGAGRNHLSYLKDQYPNSAIALGISFNQQTTQIANGQYNDNIDTLLNTLASWNRPIYLRWGYEVDGPWNAHNPAADFVRGWRYVYNRIKELGFDDRIAMVWQTATWCGDGDATDFMPWWPGKEFVDWTAFSYFTPQDCGWREVDRFMSFARQQDLPVMIAEFAPQTYDTGELMFNRSPVSQEQIWNDWYQRAFDYIEQHDDIIRAVAYINADWDSQPRWASGNEGYWGDTRVQVNQFILNNWTNEINQSNWLNASPDLFAKLGFGDVTPTPGPGTPAPGTPAPATPTPTPPVTGGGEVMQEAESASILGSARVYNDGAASGGQGVAYISSPGAGFSVTAPDTGASALTLRYASERSGMISVFVNGSDSGSLNFDATGAWVGSYNEVSINLNIPANASVELRFDNGDAALNADYVEFTTSGGPVVTPGPIVTPEPIVTPTPGPIVTPTDDFGIRQVSSNSGVVFFKDEGWSAGWNFICINDNCQSGQKNNGFFERTFDDFSVGTSYKIQLKVQDNSSGQYISPEETVTFGN